MERLTIKPWQVMQAHENGANVESAPSDCSFSFQQNCNPKFDWACYVYRIANLTADGMRLDELVEKYPEKITMKPTKSGMGFMLTGEEYSTGYLIQLLVEHPEEIKHVRVKGEEKKLRPWTMAEFEKHRDEWFVSGMSSKRKVLYFNSESLVPAEYSTSITYEKFMLSFKREDGSACGELE